MSELGENYKYGIRASREVKRLLEQASVLAAEKLSVEESHAQQLAQSFYLRSRVLRSTFGGRAVAEEAKEKAEHEAADLRNQLSSRDLIFNNLKAVLEAESVDRFKRSPAYDALLLREFEKGMRQAKKFFAMKDHSHEKALRRFDRSEGQLFGSGAEPDLGPVAGRDYEPFMQWRMRKSFGLRTRRLKMRNTRALLQLVEFFGFFLPSRTVNLFLLLLHL
ncbi:hypothetical protein LWI29_020493 [Acer saccharum]|uniref:Uncharacterized protein n=1 Tax=Acer saccharum TaxID=4024 RepID=A0AA39VZL1_ACESA|nr:hypothetical protein LWI29_020493 [Acer saccharum]